jgi:hypothetical protein
MQRRLPHAKARFSIFSLTVRRGAAGTQGDIGTIQRRSLSPLQAARPGFANIFQRYLPRLGLPVTAQGNKQSLLSATVEKTTLGPVLGIFFLGYGDGCSSSEVRLTSQKSQVLIDYLKTDAEHTRPDRRALAAVAINRSK